MIQNNHRAVHSNRLQLHLHHPREEEQQQILVQEVLEEQVLPTCMKIPTRFAMVV